MTEEPVAGALADGQWSAYAQCGPDPNTVWNPYYIGVSITVKDGAVTSLDQVFGSSTGEKGAARLSWDASENQEYLDGAVSGVAAQIRQALAAGSLPSSVDTVTGATYSSKSLFEAFYAAVKKSAAAGGVTVDDPSASSSGSGDTGKDDGGSEHSSEDANGENTAGEDDGQETLSTHYGFAYCSSSGSDSWDPYYIFVEVKAADGAVKTVSKVYGDQDGLVDPSVVYSSSQNATYLSWAIDGKFGGTGYRMKSIVKQIQAKLDAGSAVSGISTVSGATRSSKSILEAYEMAAQNAAANTGATPEDAVAAVAGGGGDSADPDGVETDAVGGFSVDSCLCVRARCTYRWFSCRIWGVLLHRVVKALVLP